MGKRVPLTDRQLAHLRMFGPYTYSIKLGPVGKELEALGLVEWMPSWVPGGDDYGITEAGQQAVLAARKQEAE